MRKWEKVSALMVMVALTLSVQAQPPAEPLPFAPSTVDAPLGPGTMGPPGPMGPGQDSPNALPANLPNISTPPGPKYDDGYHVFVSMEYLHWWTKGDTLQQSFITTTEAMPDVVNQFGQFGQSGTVAIAGGGSVHQGPLDGGRLTVGIAQLIVPLEFTGFFTHASTSTLIQSGIAGTPVIARPIFSLDPAVFTETAYLSSFPDLVTGSASISESTNFYGGEINAMLCHLCGSPDTCGWHLELTSGVRYLDMDEQLNIANSATSISQQASLNFGGAVFGQGFTTSASDMFSTRNQYGGAQVGLRASYPTKWFNFNLRGDIGAGYNHEVANVSGISALYAPPAAFLSAATPQAINTPQQLLPGGIQAVPSNSGTFTKNIVSCVGDFNATLEIPIWENLSLSFGYDLIYWTNVVRPGKQLTRSIDTRQVPTDVDFSATSGATVPAFQFNQSNFWANGLTISLALLF